jgi:glycosyltransferase involved in cell wall biosynthesis
MTISTVTIARNGAALLPRMLASVAGADEHVVLVNGCIDDTADVAQRHGCRVFETDTAVVFNIIKTRQEIRYGKAQYDRDEEDHRIRHLPHTTGKPKEDED